MKETILVVDDSSSVRSLLEDYLKEHGYRVATAANGKEALSLGRDVRPDLILLDIMMPRMDGFDFLRVFRSEKTTPIILLTARVEETDRVVGLELGADDYVTKPFSMRELLARIRAVLRRTSQAPEVSDVLQVADITLDRTMHTVRVGENQVDLTPSEFTLLTIMMATPGRVFNRMELLERMQGVAFEGAARTIDVHVRNLRKKIEPDPANPIYVETVFGVGYRLIHRPDPER